ncbi:SGNH/GDSL hydrolase family protein [Egicoccus sp. AB-alg2]|uniref:SGNH/GDSL hydrolase family protein n=1 Tax=Egicoccus sp. AB-alg2 TaxID=3242693 RepID=UPI00359D42A0
MTRAANRRRQAPGRRRLPPAPHLLLLLLLGALVLSSCDRGPAEDPPEADPADTTIDVDEPSGDQADVEGDDRDVTDAVAGNDVVDYVALGDSLATGAGAATSYVEEFAEALGDRTGADVAVTNFAVDGWTSQDLLDSLRDDDGVRAAVAEADLVTLDIGGNDLLRQLPVYFSGNCGGDDDLQCLRDAADEFAQRWDHILDEVVDLRGGDPTGVLTLDLYQPFPHDGRFGDDLDRLRPSLDAVNATIADAAAQRDVPVAQVFTAFHGPDGLDEPVDAGLISVDGLHPSNDGHRLIAEELLALDPVWANAG